MAKVKMQGLIRISLDPLRFGFKQANDNVVYTSCDERGPRAVPTELKSSAYTHKSTPRVSGAPVEALFKVMTRAIENVGENVGAQGG